jgi:hypothetical protein
MIEYCKLSRWDIDSPERVVASLLRAVQRSDWAVAEMACQKHLRDNVALMHTLQREMGTQAMVIRSVDVIDEITKKGIAAPQGKLATNVRVIFTAEFRSRKAKKIRRAIVAVRCVRENHKDGTPDVSGAWFVNPGALLQRPFGGEV